MKAAVEERDAAERVLSTAVARVTARACDTFDPPKSIPNSLSRFSVTLRKSVYKDPSLHFFDVRRLYQVLGSEGLIDAVLALDETKASRASSHDDTDPHNARDGSAESLSTEPIEKEREEQRQMALLGIVAREAEQAMKTTTSASYLGAVLLKENRTSLREFKMLRVIGKGSFGKVLLAKHLRTDKVYAVKVMDKSTILQQDAADRIMSEHNVLLGNESHPFLVALHYSFQTPGKIYFVLDYVNGGELYFHLNRDKKFSERRSLFYAAELTSALGFLHDHNVLYRDLKPENILLDGRGHIMLTDFGLCKEAMGPDDRTGTFCGTPEYLAPEMLEKRPYGRGVDWWCLGCVTYEMIVGLPPFYCQDWERMYDLILHADLTFPALISPKCKSLLQGLLTRDPSFRLGCRGGDADEVKRHPAFSSTDFSRLDGRDITPPFDPKVQDFMDLSNFDPDVTSESVPRDVDASPLDLPPPLAGSSGGNPDRSAETLRTFSGIGHLTT
eukprot:m.426244 g.426244  ORF g.426244 m.426244 type:complete len:500 (-) comp21354_c0_seq3:2739-4238(-)